ncbi:MAG TPA: Ig-like domain-containing protein, partial [Pirellulaceae bacterium]|nr:Ig-like domain-containing protein [Pirellulaceae bacterium]
ASDLGGGVVLLQVADEDGVRFNGILVPGQSTSITVTSSGTGLLDAWFDFNHDGDWNDPGEQVLKNAVVHAGENRLSVTVPQELPSNSPLGDTYARLRLSSAGDLLPTGLAVDGEVEDYKVRVLNNAAPVANPSVLVDITIAEDSSDSVIDLFSPTAFQDVNLTDGNGDFLTFTVGTRVLTIEQDGATIREGDSITIFAADGVDSRTFEFDRDGIVTSGNVAVPYTVASSSADLASSLANQITAQRYGLTTTTLATDATILLTGEGAVLLGPVFSGISVSTGLSIEILQAGATLEEGGTVTIANANDSASRTFEFDNDGVTATGNVAVPFTSTATRAELAAALAAEINRVSSTAYNVGAVVGTNNNAVVRLGGQGTISFGSVFDAVSQVSDTTLRVLQSGQNIPEGATVTISPTQGVPQTFEFTTDGVVVAGNNLVVYNAMQSQDQIAGLLAQAITQAAFGVVATVDPLQPALIRLSGSNSVVLSSGFNGLGIGTASGLQLREDGSTLIDNSTVTISTANGLASRTFEFDSNGVVAPGHLPVVFDSGSTAAEIMDRLAAQIAASNYGVIATIDPLDGTILRLSGSGAVAFDFEFVDLRLVSDEPILVPSIDIDGQSLRLDYQPNQNGIVNVTVRATDQGGLFAERTIQVLVAQVNDLPSSAGVVDATLVTPSTACQVTISNLDLSDAFNETIDLCEDQAITITLRGQDGDPLPLERQQLTFENFDQSNANGVITGITSNTGDRETGQFVFTPNANFNGVGTIVFTVRDDGSAGASFQQQSAPFTLTLNVASVNDPPTGINQVGAGAVSTAEDTSVMITLVGDDDGNMTTTEGQSLTFSIVNFPTNGTFVSGVAADGTVTAPVINNTVTIEYLPNPNFNNNSNSPSGPDRFTFSVTDDGTPPETSVMPGTVEVNVSATNDAPIPEVVSATTTTSTICQPLPGALMTGVDLTQSVSTCEDHVTTLTFGGSTGDDESSQVLTFTLLSAPGQGSVNVAVGNTIPSSTLVYTPVAGFNGTTTFVVRATDNGQTNGAADPLTEDLTVTISVESINQAPVASNTTLTTAEDSARAIQLSELPAVDGDPDVVQVLRYFVVPAAGLPITRTVNGTLSGINTTTGEVIGQLVYTPNPNFNGSDSFMFRVQDDAQAGNPPNRFSNSATVSLTVTPVNDPPVANPQSVTTNEDTAISITLTGNDGDADVVQTLTYEISTTPARGTLTMTAPDVFSYLPAANFNGTDTFTFRVRDNGTNPANLLSADATVTITVNPLNDAPQFTIGQPLNVLEDSGPQTVIAWASGIRPGPISATDEAGQIVSFTTSNSNSSLFLASGQPSVSSSGTLTFTPAPNAVGQAVLTVIATDSGSGVSPHVNASVPQTVTLTVTGVNDAPQFIKGPNQSTNEDGGLQVVPNWASNIAPGPVQAIDEANQSLQFVVNFVTTGNLAFEAGFEPKISTAPSTLGQLSYQPKANTN